MLRQPINFIYAAFIITLVGGGFTMYILQASYTSINEVYSVQDDPIPTRHTIK